MFSPALYLPRFFTAQFATPVAAHGGIPCEARARPSSGGRTRTPNGRARTCCVANYTTPDRVIVPHYRGRKAARCEEGPRVAKRYRYLRTVVPNVLLKGYSYLATKVG